MPNPLEWDIYDLTAKNTSLIGVNCRSKIRLFGVYNNYTLLTENAVDQDNTVRVAILSNTDIVELSKFLKTIFSDIQIEKKMQKVKNPVLSKLSINREELYKN